MSIGTFMKGLLVAAGAAVGIGAIKKASDYEKTDTIEATDETAELEEVDTEDETIDEAKKEEKAK